ncbi:MAG: flavin reductase family protein [Sulfolobales archaeon]
MSNLSSDLMELLEELPHPLALVLAGEPRTPGRRGGMAVAWLSRVSWDPPLIAVSLTSSRHTYRLIKEFKCFTINLVSKPLRDVTFNVFGVLSGWEVDKFKVAGVEPGSGRSVTAPTIPNSPLIIECKLVGEFPVGDHVVVIGQVVDAYRGSNESPLIYYKGDSATVSVN